MTRQQQFARLGRNLVVYLAGIGLAVAGALGLADAVSLHGAVSAALFVLGLAAVLLVHERFNGPF